MRQMSDGEAIGSVMRIDLEMRREREAAANPRAVIGSNHPPPDEPTPYEKAAKRIDDLWEECKIWLDGSPIATQAQADDLGNLLNMVREAAREADAARVAEKAPYDEKIAEITARYDPLIADKKSMKGKATLATEGLKRVIGVWLARVAEEQRAAAAKAREEAEARQRAAEAAIRAADPANLAEREAAETLIVEAKRVERLAKRAAGATANAGGGVGRAVGLRTTYRAEVTDPVAFGRHAWMHCRAEYLAFLSGLAQSLVHAGKRNLPGVQVAEEKVAV